MKNLNLLVLLLFATILASATTWDNTDQVELSTYSSNYTILKGYNTSGWNQELKTGVYPIIYSPNRELYITGSGYALTYLSTNYLTGTSGPVAKGIVVANWKKQLSDNQYSYCRPRISCNEGTGLIKEIVITYATPCNSTTSIHCGNYYFDTITEDDSLNISTTDRFKKITIRPKLPTFSVPLSLTDVQYVNKSKSYIVKSLLDDKGSEYNEAALCIITGIKVTYCTSWQPANTIADLATKGKQYDRLALGDVISISSNTALQNRYEKTSGADVNEDGSINGADVVSVYNTIVNGSSQNTVNGHKYVDLKLPSGNLWATMNLGATVPEDYGDYMSLGDISQSFKYSGKASFTSSTYNPTAEMRKLTSTSVNVSANSSPLYIPIYGIDWGTHFWQLPTTDDYEELIDNTTSQLVFQNGIKGLLLTSKNNSNTIFFPLAGYLGPSGYDADISLYMTSTARYSTSSETIANDVLYFSKYGIPSTKGYKSYCGMSTRLVYKP